MRRSTKTSSSRVALLPILVVAALLCCGTGVRAAPILSEVAVAMGDQGDAQSRRMALHAALAEAVKALVVRHVPADQRVERAKEIRAAYLNRPDLFVSRYSVVFEGVEEPALEDDPNAVSRYRIAVRAAIDRDKLLTYLTFRNFEIRTLAVLPRVLLLCMDEPNSLLAMEVVRLRFEAEGFDVQTRVEVEETAVEEQPLPLNQWAREAGAHVAMVIQAGSPKPEEGEELQPDEPPAKLEPVAVVMRAKGWATDVRTGQLLAMREAGYVGRDVDPELAARKGVRQSAERLFQALLAELVQSGWTMGEALEQLEVRVGGLNSPALLERIEEKLTSLAEFSTVTLIRVEPMTAVWQVEAVQSDYDWEQVLSGLSFEGGELAWRVPWVTGQEPLLARPEPVRPLRIEGQWLGQ